MPALPNGTITFLFTDIEGSTRLWETQPEAMRRTLARHDVLIRAAIEQYEGYVFKTMGDSFCAAFHTAPGALNAALEAQQALTSETWPEALAIKVRMALHTGAAEARDNDYFGQPLNRVARLLAAGHGGQILLSLPTEELTRDRLPPSVGLQPMGEHRLRDLNRPEIVFQLLHFSLPSDFPPLRSLDNPALPNNLPRQVTSFIGREKEIEEIKRLLSTTCLLTLTGSGGSGKTRLSLQAAADLLDRYPEGVWLIELAALTDPSFVPQTVAGVLGIREEPGGAITKTLIAALKDSQMLLVLDNCEHVLESCAHLVDTLLKGCPKVRVLVSSREALGIAGESAFRVPSLSLPDLKQPQTPASLTEFESALLFRERARAARADFEITQHNAHALATVCHRLDGIPLAIELAAARIRSMTVEELGKRLNDRFRLLTGGSRTALPRQQTLRAMIDWSYDLLEEKQRALLARISIFMGGWTLEAVEQVCVASEAEAWEALDLLTALVDKSLVMAEEQEDTTRYSLLETVRQYAREKLASDLGGEIYRRRHRDYYLALAEEARQKLGGEEQAHWLDVLETEHDNLRQAMTFCLEEEEAGDQGLRLGAALQEFWTIRGHLREGRERLALLLSRPEAQESTKPRANALNGAAVLAFRQGDYASARSLYEESLAIKQEFGDRQGVAGSLNNLGRVAFDEGDYTYARSLYEQALILNREAGNRAWEAINLNNLGAVFTQQNDFSNARLFYEESLAINRELGNRQGIAGVLNDLGIVTKNREDYAAARSLHEQSLAISRELGNRQGIAGSLSNLGIVAEREGDLASARSLYEQCLITCRELGDKGGIANSLKLFGGLNAMETKPEQAARLWGASERLREEMRSPMPPNQREDYDRQVSAARQALGEDVFSVAWEEGRAMTVEQAIAYALRSTQAEL